MTYGEQLLWFLGLTTWDGILSAYIIVASVKSIELIQDLLYASTTIENMERIKQKDIATKIVFFVATVIAFITVVVVGSAMWPVLMIDRMITKHRTMKSTKFLDEMKRRLGEHQ